MYEEEDDDLPLQYRRLTAHLQTGSADFNRRLAAYLTNQVAMRSAMDQMVHGSYNQQYPSNPQYPQNTFQSPMMHSPQSPMSYRSAPYPSPHHPSYRNMHNRAYSMATVPNSNTTPATPATQPRPLDHRRMSTPAGPHPVGSTMTQIKTEGPQADGDYTRQTQSATIPSGSFPPFWQDMGPFSTTLPPEAQQMIGPALDMNDAFQANLMHGSEHYTSSSYYPWGDMSSGLNGMPVHPSAWKNMSTTLAPSALATTPAAVSNVTTPTTPASAHATDNTAPSAGFDFGFGSQESKGLNLHNIPYPSIEEIHSGLGSGQQTPGEGFWDNYVQDATWHEEPVS